MPQIFLVDSPGASAFHVFPDCAALDRAKHRIVALSVDAYATTIITPGGDRLAVCEYCCDAFDKLSAGQVEWADELPSSAPGPSSGDPVASFERDGHELRVYADRLEVVYPPALGGLISGGAVDAIPLTDVQRVSAVARIPLVRAPRVEIECLVGDEMAMLPFELDPSDDPFEAKAVILDALEGVASGELAPSGEAEEAMLSVASAPAVNRYWGLPAGKLPSRFAREAMPDNGCAQAAVTTLVLYYKQQPWYRRITGLSSDEQVASIYDSFPPDTLMHWFGTTPDTLNAILREVGFHTEWFAGPEKVERLVYHLQRARPVVVMIDVGAVTTEYAAGQETYGSLLHWAIAYGCHRADVRLTNMPGAHGVNDAVVAWPMFMQAWRAWFTFGAWQLDYVGIAAWPK